jgi:hypothetical protein
LLQAWNLYIPAEIGDRCMIGWRSNMRSGRQRCMRDFERLVELVENIVSIDRR